MLFLIDGYNVTLADPATRARHGDDQRLALLRRLGVCGREMLGAGRIVVVFDGGHLASDPVPAGVEVRYSLDREADQVIVDLTRDAPRGGVTLVTNDRGLADRVRAEAGASTRVLPSSTLFEGAPQPHRRRPGRAGGGGADGGLPRGH
ncbi:MAG: hypothetical protein FDZ70_10585, partial [Actinobacteria bacterium]